VTVRTAAGGAAGTAARLAPTAVWDGAALLDAIAAATERLGAHRDAVNALNVFPVPDGDTGTNMDLTMRAAVDEARANAPPGAGAGEVAAKIAFGALMGARGNSGVILSQVFRGVARAFEQRDEIDGRDLAKALAAAREMAYKAVMRPVEGTMLTVVRVAAERAETVAERTPALVTVLDAAVAGARDALASTPDLLDILRQAGVVDAGGQGVVHILEGMHRYATGQPAVDAITSTGDGQIGKEMEFLDRIDELHGEDAFGYCTNFMVFGEGIDADRARADLAAMGESAVIVGDDRILKVHIHALDPAQVLAYALTLGSLDQIKIDNMQSQTRTLTAHRTETVVGSRKSVDEPSTSTDYRLPTTVSVVGRQAVLAVAAGDGLAAALRSMGACGIVAGGQTMNPSIEELLSAVEAAPTAEVILLPNNPNIVLTANQVPALASKSVGVVPSRSIPQGLAALAAYNADADLEENVAEMTAALASVRTVELTRAVRDVTLDGVDVRQGQVIGLVDDRLVASGDDPIVVGCAALQQADLDAAELVTIFTGDGAKPEHTSGLRDSISANYPDITVEVHDGGQPHYRFVIAVE